MLELINWHDDLEKIMRQAGEIVLSSFRTPLAIKEKKLTGGFVTKADLESEAFLINELKNLLPQAAFFAEESGLSGDGEYHWVIDPLDGTTNFASGLTYFCISVALTKNNIPIIGAIYEPISGDFFFAQKGKGAVLNSEPITISHPKQFKESVIAMGLPYWPSKRKELVHSAEKVAKAAYAIRHFGSIALDLANVACGRLDGVFFTYLSWWDVAAGIILIQEAGGMITDFEGKDIQPDYKTCVAGSRSIHDQVMELLK